MQNPSFKFQVSFPSTYHLLKRYNMSRLKIKLNIKNTYIQQHKPHIDLFFVGREKWYNKQWFMCRPTMAKMISDG